MILVTGAGGQLGTAFRGLVPDARYVDRAELDLADVDAIAATLAAMEPMPNAIVNCAAFTAVDAAEERRDEAQVVNGRAVGALATFAADREIPFVTFSTDYVFPGTAERAYVESDPTEPVNAYGYSKLLGERLAMEAYPASLVIRTSWLISGTHPNFAATMLRLARKGPVRVVDDQVGCPTIADDLAAATLRAMATGVTGILHLVNSGPATWCELARETVKLAGLEPKRITPCTTEEFPRPAPRPRYSVLESERLEPLGLEPMPEWRASLPDVVAGLQTLETA